MNKYVTYTFAILAILAVLSAAFIYMNYSSQVSTLQNQVNSLQSQVNSLTSKESTTAAQQNITLVDDEGYVTTLTSVPQRIVSLAPSNTQILFAIGVGDRVVGVTTYDNYPYNFSAWIEAGNMTSVGGYSTPNLEAIASLHPDLILSDTINDPILPNLRSLGYKVMVLNPTTINGVYQDISLVGRATGAEDNASAVINSISSQINNIQTTIANANVTQEPTVYYEVWYDSSTGVMSAGSTTWINDVIAKAGGINIFDNETQQWPSTSSEVIVGMNPSVILLPTGMGGTFYGSVNDVKTRPGWSSIDAVKNNRVYVIDQDLFSEPTPRVGDQVQAVAACLYPQLFSSPYVYTNSTS